MSGLLVGRCRRHAPDPAGEYGCQPKNFVPLEHWAWYALSGQPGATWDPLHFQPAGPAIVVKSFPTFFVASFRIHVVAKEHDTPLNERRYLLLVMPPAE
jgi:hypothetical protein